MQLDACVDGVNGLYVGYKELRSTNFRFFTRKLQNLAKSLAQMKNSS